MSDESLEQPSALMPVPSVATGGCGTGEAITRGDGMMLAREQLVEIADELTCDKVSGVKVQQLLDHDAAQRALITELAQALDRTKSTMASEYEMAMNAQVRTRMAQDARIAELEQALKEKLATQRSTHSIEPVPHASTPDSLDKP